MKHWRHKLLLMVVVLTACAFKRPMTEPINHRVYAAPQEEQGQKSLLVLLPGIGGKVGDFEQYGFIEAVQKRHPLTDVIVVDAHFAYYRSETLIERLYQDIFLPAQQKAYCRIDVAGISLGGYGSLLVLRRYPQLINQVYLLAPYLGEEQHYRYLLEGKTEPSDNNEHNLWPWLIGLNATEKARIQLAYGEQDKFSTSLQLLQSLLPAEGSFTIAGKHRWPVWQTLWQQGLNRHQWLSNPSCQQ